jgi:hypothetical protein
MADVDRDRLDVASHAQDRRMNIQMACPWCVDDVDFVLEEADEDLVCSRCSTRIAFAPDPVVTFGLLYEAAA